MERRRLLKTAGLATTVGLSALAGCSASTTDENEPQSNDDDNTVLMVTDGGAYYFDPIGLFVEPGTTVLFEIDSGSHSATAYDKSVGQGSVTRIPEGAKSWDSGVLSEVGATFEHTFETPGTYDYYCTPHKSLQMVGRIVVGEPGGPAEGSMPPDGEIPESATIVDRGAVGYDEFTR